MIRFRCSCGKKLKADESIIGRHVKCSTCDKINSVPAESTAASSAENKKPPAKSSARKVAGKQSASGLPKKSPSKPITTKPKPVITSLLGDDPTDNESPSLLPSEDDSSSRFKLAPEFDPEPADKPIAAGSSFDFDPALIDFDNQKKTSSQDMIKRETPSEISASEDNGVKINTDFQPRFKVKEKTSNNQTLVYLVYVAAGLGGLVAICGMGYLLVSMFSGGAPTYSTEFESLNEVKQFRSALNNYKKSRRMYRVMGEAYLKTQSPPEEEVAAYNDLLDSSSRENDDTLDRAYSQMKDDKLDQAKRILREASAELDEKRPELNSRATEYQSKGG